MTLTALIGTLTKLVLAVVPVLVALALLYFFWGVAQWILNMADTDKHKEGKQRMVWGLVALFVIASIGGLIVVLQETFFGSSSGLHSTNFGDPDLFGIGPNSLDLQGPSSDSSLPDLEGGGHATPNAAPNSLDPSSGGRAFRLIADPDDSFGKVENIRFDLFKPGTWAIFRR